MFVRGELVWVKDGLFMKSVRSGFGIVVSRHVISLDDCNLVSWIVLLDGKLLEVDASHLKQLKWYNRHLNLDGSQSLGI
jgi:hypothetical protein